MIEPNRNDTNPNPLFNLPVKKGKIMTPLPADNNTKKGNTAADLIRRKIAGLYAKEPPAKQEIEVTEAIRHRSKHQQYMHELSRSGRSLADIQTAWHNYYVNLPDNEKHQVWQEFYSNYKRAAASSQPAQVVSPLAASSPRTTHTVKPAVPFADLRPLSYIKKQLIGRVDARRQNQRPSRLSSLAFGLVMGLVVTFIMMFGFFNERFIAPFITPSRHVSTTPIILDDTANIGPEPKLIIPKINAELPVVYDEKSIEEEVVQRALERGVLHYPITPKPGELGNAVIFGHSSNNILNRGNYKFAFVLLNRLENGDIFMLHYQGKRYVYRVYEKKVVRPDDLSVLDSQDRPATATLITCDPPGTVINRLVVIGEQISPDPTQNLARATGQETANRPVILPSDAPSLWNRLWGWLDS